MPTEMETYINRERDINNLPHNGNSSIATHLNDNTTDAALSLPHNVMTNHHPRAINNRADNYTNIEQLKVQGNKSGLIRNLFRTRRRNKYNIYHNTRVIVVSEAAARSATFKSLVDRGANGGLAGDDMRKIAMSDRYIDVQGIDNHMVPHLRIGTFGAVVRTKSGSYIILIFSQYAYHGRGKSIHSCLQMMDAGVNVDDTSRVLGGEQCLEIEGYIIPLSFSHGLAYLELRPYTNEEWKKLPKIAATNDVPWDPSIYDFDPLKDKVPLMKDNPHIYEGFDENGEFQRIKVNRSRFGAMQNRNRSTGGGSKLTPSILSQVRKDCRFILNQNDPTSVNQYSNKLLEQSPSKVDFEAERLFFLNQPRNVVEKTFGATTQYYQSLGVDPYIKSLYRSPFPAINVSRRHEPVATDTVFSDVVAWGGICAAQVFAGLTTRFVSAHGVKTDKEYPDTLWDEIRKRGAMDIIMSDMAKAEISKTVQNILRMHMIKDWQSEPHMQHQNYSERVYQDVKKRVNWVLNWSGAPPESWFYAFQYVVFIMNRTSVQRLEWRTPHEALSGQTPDITVLRQFYFWELCLIKNYVNPGKHFPSESTEIPVRFLGYAEDIGHGLTFTVFNPSTNAIIIRSRIKKIKWNADINRSVLSDELLIIEGQHAERRKRLKLRGLDDPDIPSIVQSTKDSEMVSATFNPSDLIGRTFLMHPTTDGEKLRAKIVELLNVHDDELQNNEERLKFKVRVGDEEFEKIIDYNDMCQFIEEQEQEEDGTWKFRRIINHRAVGSGKNTRHEVLVEWESGECTYIPISNMYSADKFLLAEYALKHGMVDKWTTKSRNLRKDAKNSQKMFRQINQAKIQSYKNATVYMFGHEVPRNHQQAMELDKKNKNTKWRDSEKLETSQLLDYTVFHDYGPRHRARPPEGYKKITYHFVYAVKHDGRYKSRLVAGGHLTDTPTESVYSGVVSLRGVRIVIFLAELNDLGIWQTDVGNAYLEANTKEKVYVIAGPEFGDLEGHLFVIVKALYGLKSSGLRWHERFAAVLTKMDFKPCIAEPDIWMRAQDDHYEYIAVYSDDLTIASKHPKAITDELENVHKFKLKGTGELNYLLGCDYYRDENKTLCMEPRRYIEKMDDTYLQLFGEKPKQCQTPLDKNDHPELDESPLLDDKGIKIYQSLVGACQWVIQLGRFDIAVHVMSLSSFRAAPREGHLRRMRKIYGYIMKYKHGIIRFNTDMPDLSDLPTHDHDWSNTPYAGSTEELPGNIPPPRGKSVRIITYADANLCHNVLNGKAVTAVLHFLNKTPIDWFSKKQNTVETATFGAESSAARTAIEQMRANKMLLLYLGVPIEGPSVLFGDNKTCVDGLSLPPSRLHKRHLMLSYHYVREAMATGEYVYAFIKGSENPSDILSKHWGHPEAWPLLRPILFQHSVNKSSDNKLS